MLKSRCAMASLNSPLIWPDEAPHERLPEKHALFGREPVRSQVTATFFLHRSMLLRLHLLQRREKPTSEWMLAKLSMDSS